MCEPWVYYLIIFEHEHEHKQVCRVVRRDGFVNDCRDVDKRDGVELWEEKAVTRCHNDLRYLRDEQTGYPLCLECQKVLRPERILNMVVLGKSSMGSWEEGLFRRGEGDSVGERCIEELTGRDYRLWFDLLWRERNGTASEWMWKELSQVFAKSAGGKMYGRALNYFLWIDDVSSLNEVMVKFRGGI